MAAMMITLTRIIKIFFMFRSPKRQVILAEIPTPGRRYILYNTDLILYSLNTRNRFDDTKHIFTGKKSHGFNAATFML